MKVRRSGSSSRFNVLHIALFRCMSLLIPRHDQYSPRITAHLGELADDIIGSIIDGSSLSGLLTRVEIGHIRIGSAGNGRIKSRVDRFVG